MATHQVVSYGTPPAFEIWAVPGMVTKYRVADPGKRPKPSDCVLSLHVFEKGTDNIVKGDALLIAFGTLDHAACIETILAEGKYKYTTAERKDLVEQCRKQIIGYISTNYVDPRTSLPVPATRIENGLKEVRLVVDPEQSPMRQAEAILKKLKEKVPLKKKVELEVVVSAPFSVAGKVGKVVRGYGHVREDYTDDATLFLLSVSPADFISLESQVGSVSAGEATVRCSGGDVPGGDGGGAGVAGGGCQHMKGKDKKKKRK